MTKYKDVNSDVKGTRNIGIFDNYKMQNGKGLAYHFGDGEFVLDVSC